jgi:hypothetical protein
MSCASLLCALALSAATLGATASHTAAACAPAPLAGCGQPSGPKAGRLWLNSRGSTLRNSLVWKWYHLNGSPVPTFADPTSGAAHAFCIYHEPNGGSPSLLLDAEVPPGGDCGARPCWRSTGDNGFKYRDGAATPDGITKVLLNDREGDRTRVVIKARGPLFAVPDLPLALPARVQLQADDGRCWESVIPAGGASRNTDQQFRGGSSD